MSIQVKIDDKKLEEMLGPTAPLFLEYVGVLVKPILSTPIIFDIVHRNKLVIAISLEQGDEHETKK